jgi:hypothetical protein
MECPSCASTIPADSAECPECGLAVEHEPTVTYVPVEGPPDGDIGRPVAPPDIGGYALTVVRGPRAGLTFVLRDGTTTVGRHTSSDIFLDDITVSRHHCRFITEDGGLIVEDSGSTNGTYVNGSRVERQHLADGDEVIIGKFHLIVSGGNE